MPSTNGLSIALPSQYVNCELRMVHPHGQVYGLERILAFAGPLDRLSHEGSRQDHGTDGFGTFGRANISRGERWPSVATNRNAPTLAT